VHGALVAIWIIVPLFMTTMSCLMTDIVNGMCVPWGVYGSYAAEKAMGSVIVSFTFLVPATLMGFCYARIVYKIRSKVTSPAISSQFILTMSRSRTKSLKSLIFFFWGGGLVFKVDTS